MSYGPCEVCKKVVECYECASSILPKEKPKLNPKSLYIVKRYEGADPEILIAYPVINLNDKLDGWEDRTGLCYELNEDDQVYELDLRQLPRLM
jgi:DNA-directed RNA polymerase subunit RPC12/RpoP